MRVNHEPTAYIRMNVYSFQVSIKSGLYSLPFELWVVSPEAHIDGDNNEFHVDRGSEIRLVCRVSHQSAQ